MGIFSKNQNNKEDNPTVQFTPAEENSPGATATIRKVFNLEDSNRLPHEQTSAPYKRLKDDTSEFIQQFDSNPTGYGIDNAIELMRQMPDGDINIISTVIRRTLESTNVQVAEIITDAKNKEADIRSRAKRLEAEIRDLEEKVSTRNTEIQGLQITLDEITQVMEYLQIPKSGSPVSKTEKGACIRSGPHWLMTSNSIGTNDGQKINSRDTIIPS